MRRLDGEITLTLFDAGHILGSSSVLLEARAGSILLSGDLGRRGTPILRDPNTAYSESTHVDHVVIESTYGDREHPRGPALLERLRDTLRRALDDGGKVLIPAFSIGRTQELRLPPARAVRGLRAPGRRELLRLPQVERREPIREAERPREGSMREDHGIQVKPPS